MTTIAYDGKSLAVDQQMTTGFQKSRIVKLHQIDDKRFVAICGTIDDCEKLVKKIKSKIVDNDDDEDDEEYSDDFDAELVIFNNKTLQCFTYNKNKVLVEVKAPFSCGSGSMCAMTAMLMGKSSMEAIFITSQVDTCTGLGINYIDAFGPKEVLFEQPVFKCP